MKRIATLFAIASPFLLVASKPVAFAQSATAQQASTSSAGPSAPASNTPTLKVQVNEVILPVTVRDKKGEVVPNLKQDDFTLLEDGHPQTIKSFSHEANLPYRLGLLVDTSRSQENAITDERAAAGKFVDQMLGQATDKAFLIHFDHQVELLQDFTSSKSKLHHELDQMSSSSGGSVSQSGSGDDNGGRRRGGGTQLYDAIYLAANELMLKEHGRKAVILLSDGVDRGSKESLNDAIDAAEKANLTIYSIYFKGEEDHSGSGMGPGMGRHGGMGGGGYPGGGYPGGYPGGGRGPAPPSETHTDGKKIMEQIATRTGGLWWEAKKKDSFDEIFAQIGKELEGQYLLTYSPIRSSNNDDSDGFHKISLKAKDDKLTVITREGYYSQN